MIQPSDVVYSNTTLSAQRSGRLMSSTSELRSSWTSPPAAVNVRYGSEPNPEDDPEDDPEDHPEGIVYGFRTVGDYLHGGSLASLQVDSAHLGSVYVFGRSKQRALFEYAVDLEEDAITNERNMCELLREKAKHRGLNSPGSIVFWARVPDVHESWFMLTDVLRGIVIPTVDAGVPDPIITNHKELGSNYYSVSNMCELHFGIWVKAHLRSRNIVSI